MREVSDNIAAIRVQIEKACVPHGRDAAAVNIMAVSKMQPGERVRAALDAGHRLFGENRVQEAHDRWAPLKKEYPDVRLHLIGPLQTNKVRDAVALFDCVQTVDREKVADALAAEMKRQGRGIPCFIEVNTGAEPQKAGVLPENLPALLDHCRAAGLDIRGLMCIPPADDPPAPHFALLKKLAARHGLPEISMGMSGDFVKAVALGATCVRIGTALFGTRI
ncbi:MAG: YggS family pyridoxal phosphate-dependent enzyme [Proteobacteria bacterium]|nr:YggS family pyridoxal phosphate-dependent enzyme [Pseudomonadota bacterium]